MSSRAASAPHLLGVTLRRAVSLGRFFLVYGTLLGAFLGVAFAVSAGNAFSSYPYLLPIFAAVGSMGGLQVFSSDRMKGTLEYFLAYGISPRSLFANILLTAVILVTIVTAVGTTVAVTVYVARGHTLTTLLGQAIAFYSIPMCYATACFATIVGMYWSALSSPRSGMNSPIGLAPLVGVLPPVAVLLALTLGAASGLLNGATAYLEMAIVSAGLVAAVVIILLASVGRLLRSERLLSPT